MAKSEERIQNIKEYILEFQFIYHRTPTMEQIAKAVGKKFDFFIIGTLLIGFLTIFFFVTTRSIAS